MDRIKEFNKKYKGKDNAILSENLRMGLDTGCNTLVIGKTGSGKTRYFTEPNIKEGAGSYVVVDPAGSIYSGCKDTLKNKGYDIKVFNIKDMGDCNTYNPLEYCKTEDDVKRFVKNFIENTNSKNEKDPFWNKALESLLNSCVALLVLGDPSPEFPATLSTVTKLLQIASSDMLQFTSLCKEKGKSFAVDELESFMLLPEKARNCVITTALIRFDIFNVKQIKKLTSSDNINLNDFKDSEKTALFIITPVSNTTYNVLATMLIDQIINIRYKYCDKLKDIKGLKVLRFFVDEFPNTGKIPDLPYRLSTMRKAQIQFNIMCQSLEQIKTMYPKNYSDVIAGCPVIIFMGCDDSFTLNYISKMSKPVPEVISYDEIRTMPYDREVVMINNEEPIIDHKYDPDDLDIDDLDDECECCGKCRCHKNYIPGILGCAAVIGGITLLYKLIKRRLK